MSDNLAEIWMLSGTRGDLSEHDVHVNHVLNAVRLSVRRPIIGYVMNASNLTIEVAQTDGSSKTYRFTEKGSQIHFEVVPDPP